MSSIFRLFIGIVITSFTSIVIAAGNPEPFKGILLASPEKERLAVIVELARGTMSLVKTQGDNYDVIDQLPVSIGKNGYGKQVEGDKRTPVGVYDINGYIADEDLPPLYGIGAFTLDYPNFLDKKAARTGSGIWIHGVDKKLSSRPFLDSDGCVVLDNKELARLSPHFDKRPTVILTDHLPTDSNGMSTAIKSAMAEWEQAWESTDVEQYLTFYSPDFDNGQKTYNVWVEHKRRVGQQKTFIDVAIKDVQLIRHPGDELLVQADFIQTYKSNNFNGTDAKRQYWRKSVQGNWQIIYEASL